jgi:hypothetical protein
MCVKLFAVDGYGMTQSFIQFNKLIGKIRPNDIVILGYADFSDLRSVIAPSRLRQIRDWHQLRGLAEDSLMLPKAALDGQGAIHISYVQIDQVIENQFFIFWLTVRCDPHHLILAGVDLETSVIGEGRIQQAE